MTPALTLSKTTSTVTPDGIVNTDGSEAWKATWITLTDQKAANITSGMSAKFQMAYNDTYLWIAAQQNNNVNVDTSYSDDPWQRDCFEIMIGTDTNSYANQGRYKEGDLQFRMIRGTSGIQSPFDDLTDQSSGRNRPTNPDCFTDAQAVAQNNSSFKIGQTDGGTSFTQEWQIPWSGLVGTLVDSGKFLGNYFKFEIQAADCTSPGNNNGRSQQIFWHNNSDNEYQDTRTFSLIYLANPVSIKAPPISGDSINILSPNKKTVWKAGNSDTINIYFKTKSSSIDYAIYYHMVGGSLYYINQIFNSGNSTTIWNISNTIVSGKYQIVLYDYYSGKYYYGDTFNIKPADPHIKIISPYNNSHIQVGKNMTIEWTSVYNDSVNIEFSTDNGKHWDTLAHKIISIPNFNYNSKKVKIDNTSNLKGILKISNYTNKVFDSIQVNLSTLPEYNFIIPNDTSKIKAGTSLNIKFNKIDSLPNYWNLLCYKVSIDSVGSILNYYGTQLGLVNLNIGISQMVDSGKYYLQLYDYDTGQGTNSDTFKITPADPVLSITSPSSNYYLISGEKFNLSWSSISLNNIFIVFSKDGGSHWDTLATNIPTINSYNNKAVIKAPIVSSQYTNCILRIGSKGKSVTSFLSSITLSNISPYKFISPTKNSVWTADSSYIVQYSNTSSSGYSYAYYQKIDSSAYNYLNYGYSGQNSFTWQINKFIDSGFYRLAIYDYNYARYFYSDTFYIAPAAPELSINSPGSNYYLFSGETFTLNWSSISSGTIKIEWSKDGGSSWDTMATNILSPNSSYNSILVKVPKVNTTYNNCLLKIVNNAANAFSIITNITISNKSPYQFITPNDTTKLVAGNSVNIKFNNSTNDYWSLNYVKIGGYTNSIYWSSQNGLINYQWNTYNTLDSGLYQMAIYDETLNRYFYSDTFAILPAPPSLSITSYLQGTTIYSGSQIYLNWSALNSGNINVAISNDGGTTWNIIASNLYSYNSTYNSATITFPKFNYYSTKGILKIYNNSNSLSSVISNLIFSNILPHSFVYPNKQTVASAGYPLTINVLNNNMNNYGYFYFYYRNLNGYSNYINSVYTGDSSIVSSWNIPQSIDTGKYQIYFYDNSIGQYIYSDTFTVTQSLPNLTILYPQPGTVIYAKSEFNIHWSGYNTGNINVELSYDNGLSWDTIARNIAYYDSSFRYFTAPNFDKVYINGKLKISNLSNSQSFTVSNLTFTNVSPYSFISPDKATNIFLGTTFPVKIKSTVNNYWELGYEKVNSVSNIFSSGNGGDTIKAIWNIPEYTDTGLYYLYIYDFNLQQYFYSDSLLVRNFTSINQSNITDNIVAFPNPFDSNLKLSFDVLNTSNFEVSIYNMLGESLITVYKGQLVSGHQQLSIDCSSLKSGMYVLHLNSLSRNSKLVIVKK